MQSKYLLLIELSDIILCAILNVVGTDLLIRITFFIKINIMQIRSFWFKNNVGIYAKVTMEIYINNFAI